MNACQINKAITLINENRGMEDAETLAAILELENWFGCGILEILEILK